MFGLAHLVWALIILYVVVSRGLPKIISWILCKVLDADLKIGQISLLPFSLKDVIICKNDVKVVVDCIGLSSNLVNSAYSKILAIYVSDVRIQKELNGRQEEITPVLHAPHGVHGETSTLSGVSHLNVPPQLISLSQITCIHIYNVNIMLLKVVNEWLVNATISEVRLEGASDKTCLQAIVNINNFTCKLLHHVSEVAARPILAELSLSADLTVSSNPKNNLKIKSFSLNIHPELEVTLSKDLFSFVAPKTESKSVAISRVLDNVLFHSHTIDELFIYEDDDGSQQKHLLASVVTMAQCDFQHAIITNDANKSDAEDDSKNLQGVPKILPETLNVNLENTKVTVHCEDKSLSLSLLRIECSASFTAPVDGTGGQPEEETLPGKFETTFLLEELNLGSGSRKMVTLARTEIKISTSEIATEASVTVSTFSCLYYQDDVMSWLQNVTKLTQDRNSSSSAPAAGKTAAAKNARILSLLSSRPHKVTLELWDLTTICHFTVNSVVGSGLNHARLTSEGKIGAIKEKVDQSVDGLVESLWCHIGERPLPDNPNKKLHYWRTPVFVGVLLFKLKRNSCWNKLESMVDCAQLEWNPHLENVVADVCSCLRHLQTATKWNRGAPASSTRECKRAMGGSGSPKKMTKPAAHVHLTITNTNLFANCNNKASFVLRVDSGSFETQQERLVVSLEGNKLATTHDSGQHFPCVKSSEMKAHVVHVPACTVARSWGSFEVSVQLPKHVSLHWDTTNHMTVYCITGDVVSLWRRLKELFPGAKVGAAPSAARQPGRMQLRVAVGGITVNARLSSKNAIGLNALDLSVQYEQGSLKLHSDKASIKCDEHQVFKFRKFGISSSVIGSGGTLKMERAGFEDLDKKDNRAWHVQIASVSILFPHKYNFAETFSEKTIGIVKWIKFLHKRKQSAEFGEEPLPPDLSIKIQEFLVEILDDPFEIRLRDNYELLEDEYNESQKRWKMLDLKVNELRKTHLHLPATKVEELYQSLARRNAGIYIKRSQQMFASTSRTQLYTFRVTAIEILALADPTMHGRDKVLAHVHNLDPDSPRPEEPMEFSTLWCRMIQFSAASMTANMRDYSAPLLSIKDYHVWGMLIGAEQSPNKRAKRTVVIEIGEPWMNAAVESSMTPLKFFHDFSCDIENMTMGYGPCWEPAMAELNLAADLINRQSTDPSPTLPVWDKLRLLLHGRLTTVIQQLTMVLHASLDPYNTTEQVDYTWTDLAFDWTNAKFVLKGNLDVFVRTASKYDDCHFLHFPNLKLVVKLDWQCLGDPNDHFSVSPCAPDKLPEYSSNQKHDSYRAFRSVHLNLAIAMDTKPVATTDGKDDIPGMLFYSNTLKWLDNLKVILAGVTRPTRRGVLFNNCKPPKISLSRHYKSVRLSLSLHQFEVCYWMSFAKQRGFHLRAQKLALSSEYNLALVAIQDGLKHRPRSVWSVVYMNCELSDGEIWLQSAASDDAENEMNVSFRAPVEKNYFLSLSRLSYGREAGIREVGLNPSHVADTPNHRLVVHDLKGLWTKNNRTIVFCLFDSFMKNKLMRHNLSTEALKGFRTDPTFASPMKSRGPSSSTSATPVPGSASPVPSSTTSPLSRVQLGNAINMLQKLIAEADNNAVVFSEDLSGNTREQILHGVVACQTDDVLHRNWLVELINSQILLKGCETPGYVIISAARAQILQRIHKPAWKERSIVSKTTWVGSLECMQYYATVDSGELNFSTECDNIQWLNVENIVEKDCMVISDLPDLVGSGQGVGGVVSNTVGGGNIGNRYGVQLQRIVSRCGCQFFYASYGESLDPNCFEEVPPLPPEDPEIWKQEPAVDSFTLTHHDLNCSTNSLQYAMLLDVVNNLLMYVEPGKKEATEKLQRLRFQLQLSSVEDQRRPILLLQNNLRSLISNLRRLEKEMYMVQKAADDEVLGDENLFQQMESLENQMYETKVQMSSQAEDLAMIISCFKEWQILAARNLLKTTKDRQVPLRRRSEVCFRHAQWRLTEADGQLGIADIALSNFLYSKVLKIDDSAEHLLELGYIKVTNLLPNQTYKDVLQPTALRGNIPIDRQCALRIFCREKAPVGGISIKEHFEVNVVPMTLRLTYFFFKTMLKFCFPERDAAEVPDPISEEAEAETASISSGGSIRSSRRRLPHRRTASTEDQDDIEKMKERAEKNKMFLYIKIPEVPVKVSYKGEKEKNIEDVHDFNLVLQTLEYHNVTWTWLDLLLAMKSDSKKALLSQAIKQKLQLKRSTDEEASSAPHEEDKMRLLMGSLLTGGTEKRGRPMFGKLHKTDPK